MTTSIEPHGFAEELDAVALAAAAAGEEPAILEAPVLIERSSRKSVVAFALCALAVNGAAAIYTSSFDLSSRTVTLLADVLPRLQSSAPKPDPVVAALKEIQSAQQQHTASLQENNHVLQQNAALAEQDALVLLSLRQSITDERIDVKKISSQLSTLIAKIDALQNATMSDVTSSIRKAHARYGFSAAMRKRMAREAKPLEPKPLETKPLGPVSVGGAPLSVPAATSAPES